MARILNLRGTSGAGKTHIVRRLMEQYATKTAHHIPGRKQPIGYTFSGYTGDRAHLTAPPLFVAGHYEGGEGGCGGCDNLSQGLDYIYDLIREHANQGEDVVYEGLIVASDWRRCAALAKEHRVLVIGLTTPLRSCLESVQSRRDKRAAAKGLVAEPLNPKNTEAKYKALLSQQKYFRQEKMDFRLLDRNEALDAALAHFGLPALNRAGEVAIS